MNPPDQEVRLELACEPESARIAREAVAGLAERLGIDMDDVRIVVSEAVGNAILHAYRGGDAGTIGVLARQERGRLLVTVADYGVGMLPNPDSVGLRAGIPLITKICDDVRFASSDDGTRVSMSFEVPAPARRA